MTAPRALLLLLVLILLAAALRFPGLSENPRWYSDEAFYLLVSQRFAQADFSTFSIGGWTPVSPFSPTPPLFHVLAGFLTQLFGPNLLVSRAFTATVGVAVVAILFVLGRKIWGDEVGAIAALTYAVLPRIVANNRWGLPHTLAGLFVLFAALGFVLFRQTGKRLWLIVALGGTSLALLTTFWVLPLVIVVPLLLWSRLRWRSIPVGLLPVLPLAVVLAAFALQPGSFFWADLLETIRWYTGSTGGHPLLMVIIPLNRLFGFLALEPLIALGAIGLGLASRGTRWPLLVIAASLLLFLFVSVNAPARGWFYPYLISAPLIALGVGFIGAILIRGADHLASKISARIPLKIPKAFVVAPVAILLTIAAGQSAYGAATDFTPLVTDVAFIRNQDNSSARAAATYVNDHASAGDFVVAPNVVSWLIRDDVRAADVLWVVCYESRENFPNLPDRRLRYDSSVAASRFWVIDASFPGDSGFCRNGRDEVWRKFDEQRLAELFRAGSYTVYGKP